MEDYKRNPFYMKFNPLSIQRKITSSFGTGIPDWFRPDLKNNTLLRHMIYRKHLNMNTFICVVGNVRTGKSYFALKFAEMYMKDQKKKFNTKKQCSFELLPFLLWSQSNYDSSFVLDEIQLSMGSREWYSIQNRVFNQFCDIQGFRRNILFMTMPNISFIDKHLRFLINYIVRTMNQGKVTWFKVSMRHELGKGWLSNVGSYKFTLPSKNVVDTYEAMKKKFNDEHLKDSILDLEKLAKPDRKTELKEEYYELRNERMKQEMEFKRLKISENQERTDKYLPH